MLYSTLLYSPLILSNPNPNNRLLPPTTTPIPANISKRLLHIPLLVPTKDIPPIPNPIPALDNLRDAIQPRIRIKRAEPLQELGQRRIRRHVEFRKREVRVRAPPRRFLRLEHVDFGVLVVEYVVVAWFAARAARTVD